MMRIELGFEDLTWGEIREFVRMAEYVPDSAKVAFVMSPQDEETPVAFSLYYVPEGDTE